MIPIASPPPKNDRTSHLLDTTLSDLRPLLEKAISEKHCGTIGVHLRNGTPCLIELTRTISLQ